jgi:lysophospholipase L1-like esterase
MKNLLIIIASVIVILIVYLLIAHHLVYAKIGSESLKNPDTTHEYMVGKELTANKALVYTAVGDSLTAGVGADKYEESYPYLLAQKFAGSNLKIDLRVQAYPGARTSDVIRDLLELAVNNQPDVVTVLLGVNDIHGFVSQTQFAENYQEILTRLKTGTKAKIYAISIPYIGTDQLILPPYDFYFRQQTIKFNEIIKKLAAEDNIEYVDLYTPTENMYQDHASFSADFFHPSAKGYGIWTDAIYANINK